jgi:dihydrofolate synthase/folylpolyglutamate synthase
MISGTDVAAGLEEIRELTGDWEHSPTFFEITTALALAHFQRAGAEVVILETGMGGRLDATNVVTPAVSVITRIDLDHQQWLGSSLAEIAFEKGGIIKPEVPVVTTPQEDEVRCMLVHLAMERGATYHEVVTPIRRLPLALTGRQQQWNAALAVHALELAGIEAESSAIAQGLASAEWPGRFQRVGDRLVLDGAHNPSAATQLVETWREIFPDKKATLVLGAARDKDLRSICSILAPIAARAIVVPLQNERSCSVEELSTAIREAAPDLPVSTATNFNAARAEAEFYAERILITGSFFLIGEALAHLGERTEPLELSVQ